jgi:hypothetical protein
MLSNALQRRSTRRASTVVLAVGALLAGGAVSASAATVDGTDAAPIFNAVTGEINDVTVTQDTNTGFVSFHDASGPITTTVCTQDAPVVGDVTCGVGGASITLNLDDGDDSTHFSAVTAAIDQHGGLGNDILAASDDSAASTINGDDGDDTINGGAHADTINGGAGDDIIAGNAGNDTIDGGDGDDSFTEGPGADDIHGGASVAGDSVTYQPTAANLTVSFDDVANDAGEGDNVHSDVEFVQTGSGNDTLVGGPGAQLFDASAGDDSIDMIDGAADLGAECGDGNDILYADAADLPNPFTTCEATSNMDAMSFGSLTVGGSTAAQTVTVTNTGTAPLTLGAAAVTGAFNKTADTCTSANLLAGATCTVSASFAPTSAGALAGTLSIPTAGQPFSIALSGTGVAAPVVTPPGAATVTPPPPPPPPPPPVVIVKPAAAKSVSAKVKPSRDRSKPYSFTFSGKVSLPAGVTKANGCKGTVTVTLKNGKKTVTTKKASVKKDCTYSAKVKVSKKAKMKASVKFGGNSAVGAKTSATINVRAG